MTDASILSAAQRRAAVLWRQGLTERHSGTVAETLDAIGGIQAQYAPSMYIGLWSRLAGFERGALTSALEAGEVVQGTLMRSTIHLVSRADYWIYAIGTRRARQEWWLKVQRIGATRASIEQVAARVRDRLRDGPARRSELDELVGNGEMEGLAQFLDMVRVPPSGTWERRRADVYALAEQMVGPEPELDPDDAAAAVLERYLRGFGPARPKDAAGWAGMRITPARPLLDRLLLVRYRGDDGEELVDVPDARLPPPELVAPARFLPTWDSVLLAHARATGILREEDRPTVFHTRNPQSDATFTVNGVVAGTWRHDGTAVVLHPFRALRRAEQRAIDDEADRIGALFA